MREHLACPRPLQHLPQPFRRLQPPHVHLLPGHKKVGCTYEEGYTNFIVNCPVCVNSTDEKVFVNKRTGAFTCEHCKHTGSWLLFDTYLSKSDSKKCRDPSAVKELKQLEMYLQKIKKDTIAFKDMTDEAFADFLKSFNLPDVLTKCTFQKLDIRLSITNDILHVPLRNSAGTIVNYRKFDKNTDFSQNIHPKLFYTNNSGVIITKHKNNKAVIVAKLTDYLILTQLAIPYNIICLPNGLQNLSQFILPCFEKFTKIILWFGNEMRAWDCARQFAKKLGEKRCLFVKPMEGVPTPGEDSAQDFKAVLGGAQPIAHKSITTFSAFRQDVLAELQNVDRTQGVKWKRFPGLNKILRGHRRGELSVFTGPTGSGKTTFISEYSLDLAMQGVNTLWGSFEIRNTRLAKTMLQQLAGFPLDEHIERYDHWADIFEQLPIYYMTFHGQQSIKVVMDALEHAVYVHDIAHVIIDNLQFMMGLTDDARHLDRFWKQDLIVANLRTFATRRNCHVTLVIHPRKERVDEDLTTSSIFGGAKASQEADNILIIQDKRLLAVKGKKYLQITKNRFSGDLGVIPLEFDKAALSFAAKPKAGKVKVSSEQ